MAIAVTDATFAREVLQAELPVLVDFTAPWCRPCRVIEPLLEELATEHAGSVKLVSVDVDTNLATPGRYGVLSLPTVVVFVAGEPKATLLGANPKRRYAEALAPFLG
jgi:thioredoxin 1